MATSKSTEPARKKFLAKFADAEDPAAARRAYFADLGRRSSEARTSPDYHLDRIRDLVARTRAAQGLPEVVVDELTLSKVAEILKRAA